MRDTRDLTGDPAALRALAHPVRLTLLELLGRDGPLTASEAARLLGELPGNVSWHFRVLARHGFVTAAAAGGGRRRPWQLTAAGQRFDADPASEEERLAADAVLRTVVERGAAELRAWLASRFLAPQDWRRAAALSDWTLYLTAAETDRLREQVYALFEAFSERLAEPARRPPGALPVRALLALHPAPPPRRP